MKSVPLHALAANLLRQRIDERNLRHGGVKRSVEARKLLRIRKQPLRFPNQLQGRRNVQRRKMHGGFEGPD